MAIYQNDPFGIGDYSNYASWKQVKMPDGQIYYEVPGNPGYVFDPVASRASGRKVFRKNPQLAITQQEEEQKRLKEIQEQEAFNRSPTGQLLPVAGSTAGLIAASQLMKPAADPVSTAIAAQIQQQTAAQAAASGAVSGGSAAGGGFAGAGVPATPNLVGATAVPTQAAAPTILGNAAGMGVLPLAAIAAGTYLGGEALYDMYKGRKPGLPGRIVAGVATGGLSEIAKATGLLGHKSTKEHQSDRWAEMAQSEDPATAAYAQQYLDVIDQGDGSGITFEQIQAKPDKSGKDVWGASAFFDAFKDKGGWLNTTEAQREAIAKRALDEGLLTGDHGDIVAINDDALNRIKLIGDEVIQTPAQAAATGAMRSNTLSPGIGLDGLPIKKLNPSLRR